MILCGERDYTGPIDSIIQGHPLTEEERIPINSLQDKYNLTMMQANIYMEENLQLMKQLIPQMDKVIYIGDEHISANKTITIFPNSSVRSIRKWDTSSFLPKTLRPTACFPS
mgnify:CR=1 FL=1